MSKVTLFQKLHPIRPSPMPKTEKQETQEHFFIACKECEKPLKTEQEYRYFDNSECSGVLLIYLNSDHWRNECGNFTIDLDFGSKVLFNCSVGDCLEFFFLRKEVIEHVKSVHGNNVRFDLFRFVSGF